MSHKYLNNIGIKSEDPCIFNTNYKDKNKNRQKRFNKQRKKYGFDERETWSMDITLATWLYSHLKAYKKYAKIIDLNFHKFNIPEWDDQEIFSKNEIEVTQKEAINIAINNLEYYLVNTVTKWDIQNEDKATMKFQYALRIVEIILPALWW